MFDAGSIEATLTVRLDQFNADLDRAEERVRRFEETKHQVNIGAVFDSASFSKARKMFADLDQQISRDAATRLRSSPQGSVLGSLNALFSPHPVSGSPTPQQSGQQGQLGRMFNTPGGGGGSTGPAPSAAQQPMPSPQAPAGGGVGGGGGGGQQRNALGQFSASQQQQQNQQQSNMLTNIFSKFFGSGGAVSGGIANARGRASAVGQQVSQNSLVQALGSVFGAVGNRFSGSGNGNAFKSLSNAALPGILGLSTKVSTGIGVGGSVLGALPALLGPLAALGVGGAGAGAAGIILKGAIGNVSPFSTQYSQAQTALQTAQTPAQRQAAQQQMAAATQGAQAQGASGFSIFQSLNQIKDTWGNLTASFQPQAAKILTTVSSMFTSLLPTLTKFFSSAVTLVQPLLTGVGVLAKDVLPGLGQAFQAVAPLMEPFLASIGKLFQNLLPGLITAFKAIQPILGTLEGILGNVGKQLGALFADFAPVMQPAAVLLKAILDLVLSFLPLIGQLAALMASSLAPAFQLFAGLLKQLTPVLIPIGKILAELAGAVLADLISILAPLVALIGKLSPTFAILATVLGDVFNTLENAGVFQVLADALYTVVTPLASFINMLVKQLAPFIPPLLSILNALINAGIMVFTDAILALLPILTKLVQALLPPLLTVVISLVPVISQLAALMARGLGDAIVALATVLTPLLVLLAHLITNIITWANESHLLLPILALVLLAIDPIPTAIGLIAIAIGYLAEHWRAIWGDIKQWASDAWNFIWNGFGKFLLPLLGPVGLIALGVIELYQHWKQIWGDIKQVGLDFYQWIWSDFGAKIANFLTTTLPNAFTSAVNAISNAWGAVENILKVPANFLINTVYDNGIRRFWNDVMGAIHGPTLPFVQGLATGGKINSGSGPTADDVLIRASRGETVVSAAHSRLLAPVFAAVGVPGYSIGGIVGDVLGAAGALVSGASTSVGGPAGFAADILSGNWTGLSGALLKMIGLPKGVVGDIATMFTGIPKTIVSTAVNWAKGAIGSAVNSLVFGPSGGGPVGSGPTANAALAKILVPQWATGANWISWNNLEMREAGWNNTANNPSSGAYGIAQALPFTKMP
jgi:phage-related protein